MRTLLLLILFTLHTIRFLLHVTATLLDLTLCYLQSFIIQTPYSYAATTYESNVLPSHLIFLATHYLVSQTADFDTIDDFTRQLTHSPLLDETPQLSLDLHDHLATCTSPPYSLQTTDETLSFTQTVQSLIPDYCIHSHSLPTVIKSSKLTIYFEYQNTCYVYFHDQTTTLGLISIKFEILLALATAYFSFYFFEIPFVKILVPSQFPILTTIHYAISCIYTSTRSEIPDPICYLTLPYSHLSPLESNVHLFPTLNHLMTIVSEIFTRSLPSSFASFSQAYTQDHSYNIHVLESSPAIKFMTASFHRLQLHCTANISLFPFLNTVTQLALLNSKLVSPPPGNFTDAPVYTTLTDMFLALPTEIRIHIFRSGILSNFQNCQCHSLECHKRKHTNQCRKGKVSRLARYPKMFPISHSISMANRSHFSPSLSLYFVLTVPFSGNTLVPSLHSTSLDYNSILESTVILSPCHAQLSVPPLLPIELVRLQNKSPHIFARTTLPILSRHDPVTSCPLHEHQFIPKSHRLPAHTLVFD